jgi:putative tricarboxylic transport membrane protein
MTLSAIIFVISISVVIGAIVGLMPGLPAALGLLLMLPVLAVFPPEAAVLFFCCYICVTQYFGSVSALLFKIPGEGSSLPALAVAQQLKQPSSIIKAYRVTAFTSFVASMFAIALLVGIYFLLQSYWPYLFSIKFVVTWLTILLILLMLQGGQYLFNISMLLLGLAISYANEIPVLNDLCTWSQTVCFLRTSPDITLILLSLFCVPVLFYRVPRNSQNPMASSYMPGWRTVLPFWRSGLRHGFLGFVTGFTPGAGLTLASNISHSIERRRNPNRLLTAIGSAEASNNAAAISCAIPFLLLALPITPSEIVLENYLTAQFFRWEINRLEQVVVFAQFSISFFSLLIGSLVMTNIACLLASGTGINLYHRFLQHNLGKIMMMARALIVMSLIMLIWFNNTAWNTAAFAVIFFGAIGVWAQRSGRDIIGLALTIVLGRFIIEKFGMFAHLYF